jgi:hypothetical protein
MVLSTGAVVDHVRQGVGTGLSRVLADGTVRTIDEDRFALPGATQPCFAGDLAVGEGNPDGALWRLSEKEGVAWPGEETFVPKCAMLGDRVALTTSGGRGGIRLFCGSREELALLQRDDPPDPDPEKPMITEAQMATLKAERARYPDTVTPEQIGAIINATCWKHRDDPNVPGMQRKDSGTHSIQPRTGFGIWNGMRYRDASGQHWGEDICGGCSVGQFNPVHQAPGLADPATFVPPVEPVDMPPDTGLETRVAALERDVVRLRYECSVTKGLVESLESRVYALESNPGGGLSATDVLRLIAAAFDNHVAVGSTGKSYGHAHSAELPLKTKIEAAIR